MSKYVSICEEPPYIILPLESHEGGGHNTSLQSPWLILLFLYFSIRQDYFIIHYWTGCTSKPRISLDLYSPQQDSRYTFLSGHPTQTWHEISISSFNNLASLVSKNSYILTPSIYQFTAFSLKYYYLRLQFLIVWKGLDHLLLLLLSTSYLVNTFQTAPGSFSSASLIGI